MKLGILITILLAVLLTACSSNNNPTAKTMTENITIVKTLFEHFNKHEWEKMSRLYSEPADFKDPSFGPKEVKQTRNQTAQKYQDMQKMSPDIRDEIIQIYSSGDKNVIVEFVSSGTAPDGTKWNLPICTIFTIENGQITRDATYYDNPGQK